MIPRASIARSEERTMKREALAILILICAVALNEMQGRENPFIRLC